jgi:membrane protein
VLLGLSFRLYVTKWGKYNQTYGTVGGVAILLLFFYIDALVLLIGAEINSEVDFEVLKVRRGTRDFRCAQDVEAAVPTSI